MIPILARLAVKNSRSPSSISSLILLQARSLSCQSSTSKSTSTFSNLTSTKSRCNPSFSSKVQSRTSISSFHSSSSSRFNDSTPTTSSTRSLPLYQGPLASTFRRLKLFSLSSFALATALTPVLLFAPAELGMPARIALAVTALATSGSSFALIGWISAPYVTEMRLRNSYLSNSINGENVENIINDGKKILDNRLKKAVLKDEFSSKSEQTKLKNKDQVLECLQLNHLLVPLITTIYQPHFLTSTNRPFCSWSLSKVPPLRSSTSENQNENEKDSSELLIAETRHAKTGELKGRWIAKWSDETKTKDLKDGSWKSEGICYEKGKVVKYFNVHEELLGDEWKVLG